MTNLTSAQTWYMFFGESIPSAQVAFESWDDDFQTILEAKMDALVEKPNDQKLSEDLVEYIKQSLTLSLDEDAPEDMPNLGHASLVLVKSIATVLGEFGDA